MKYEIQIQILKSQRQIWDILQGVCSLAVYFKRKILALYDK